MYAKKTYILVGCVCAVLVGLVIFAMPQPSLTWLQLTAAASAKLRAAFVRLSSLHTGKLPEPVSYEDVRTTNPEPSPLPVSVLPPTENPPMPVGPSPQKELQPAKKENRSLPAEINLAVPFTSQAPHANWNLPYQEACEEASLLMVARYKKGEPIRSPEDADAEIKKIIAFEEKLFGYYEDTTAEEVVRLAKELYGFMRSRAVYDFSVEQLKSELAAGNPVILPAAGRLLPNPNFRSPGPLYHMLVVRGYTKDGTFITNDPGTRKGKEFLYRPGDLLNAVHDWNGGDVVNGRKVMIILD